ncbi:glycoside hydrolase family 43 protein [Actinotalea sp. AC32]|nr:glycoside hydrolase family 43 protein [Actinotalea sp. AC32]
MSSVGSGPEADAPDGPQARTVRNPVLPGCHPDPTVCRVGDDYYLATSSFEYVPGIPLFHSRDLVHWRPIGHAVDRPEQLSLAGVRSSEGLYAPTLRHHEGTFYLTSTLVGPNGSGPVGNFVVTAQDPAGPWSEPVWWEDEGIDPALFFDDDGRAWATGTRESRSPQWDEQAEIWVREMDRTTLRLVGPEHVVWRGALLGAAWAEAPRLLKVEGWYHLLAAEGGTEHHHAVSVARSTRVTGPYAGNRANPVLTHRHLGRTHPVMGVGHADLVELPDRTWWAVVLGTRPYGGLYENLGRETFLVPVTWEDGWPVFAPGVGQVRLVERAPSLPAHAWPEPSVRDSFAGGLGLVWNAVRGPAAAFAQPGPEGGLDVTLLPATLDGVRPAAFVGRRQQHVDVDVTARLRFEPASADEWFGLVVRQSDDHHYLVVVAGAAMEGGPRRILVVRRHEGRRTVLLVAPAPDGAIELGLRVRGQEYQAVLVGEDGEDQHLVTLDGRMLDSTVADSFVGVWLGLYGTSNGMPSTTTAHVEWFEYAPVTPAP